jgi:large repetitive protein
MRRFFVMMFILAGSLVCWSQTFSANATSIDFGGDPVGGAPVLPAGPERAIVITNTGTATLSISAIQESGEFFIPVSRFPPLPIQVNPGQTSQEIPVDFVPTAAGPRSGSISFTDNAPDSPQTISLTGIGLTTDFSLAVANIPASSAVTAGQTAGYELDLASGTQFSGPITLSCTGLPQGAGFSVLAEGLGTQFGLASGTLLFFSVGITTTARTTAQNRSQPVIWYGFGSILAFAVVAGRRRRKYLWPLVSVLMLLPIVSCGGGSSNKGPTPAGTYNVMFTATSGSTTHTAPATLIVK